MSKWTPVPWVSDGCYLRGANGEPDIARIYQPMGMPDEERNANARLIAAAPEMAEVLEAITKRMEWDYTEGPCVEQSVGAALPPELYAARAILARINGDEK